jgi:hypothetical protein
MTLAHRRGTTPLMKGEKKVRAREPFSKVAGNYELSLTNLEISKASVR